MVQLHVLCLKPKDVFLNSNECVRSEVGHQPAGNHSLKGMTRPTFSLFPSNTKLSPVFAETRPERQRPVNPDSHSASSKAKLPAS
ncbi:hypothetical protein E2C01_009393 [Portunus trituberculatus]|uniref:Uncharacterized protein n=1 Tax=Portunus trituberculatus TaxID=210409 RepID=A0A5B7D5H9_PORTR|nr:hypothetical protein [Portunus trituberculatus]